MKLNSIASTPGDILYHIIISRKRVSHRLRSALLCDSVVGYEDNFKLINGRKKAQRNY